MAQSVSAWPSCKRSQVRSGTLFRLLSVLCSINSFNPGGYSIIWAIYVFVASKGSCFQPFGHK